MVGTVNNDLNINQDFIENTLYDEESQRLIKKEDDGDKVGKTPLKDHKYKIQCLLLLIGFAIFSMISFLYNLFLPNVFTEYVTFHFPDLDTDQIQTKASYYKSFSDSVPFITMALLGPLAGVLSDKFGRKPILYVGLIVNVLDIASCYVSLRTHNLVYFYIFHILAGISNIYPAAIFAAIADISIDEHIPVLYSFSGVSIGLGVLVGPGIFVFSSSSSIPYLTLYITLGLSAICILIVPFLKESLTIAKTENRIKPTKGTTSNPFIAIKNLFTQSGYITMVIILFISINYTSQDLLSTFYYYLTLEYNFGSSQNGQFMAYLGFLIILMGLLVIPFLLKFYSERKLVSLGFGISVLGHILMVLSGKSKYLYIAAGFFISYVPNNMNLIQSVITRATPPDITGTILVGINSIGALASFVGALVANDVYLFSIDKIYFPQLIYLVNGSVVFITMLFSLFVWRKYKNPNPNL